jgi:uncharacterized protein (TIGR02145 family)
MRKHLYIAFLALLSALNGFSQQTITLTFTAIDSSTHVQLDSIKVMNRTQGGDTTLYWNDTVLVLNVPLGLPDIESRMEGLEIRSFPNPVTDHTTIELVLPEPGETVLTVSDVFGRSLYVLERVLQSGSHVFQFVPSNDPLYFFTATWNGYRKSIKVLNSSRNKGRQCTISYQGHGDVVAQEKTAGTRSDFSFELGDELQYIGYVDTLESGMLDNPDASQIYNFQFAYNIPCIGKPTIAYEGQVFNTVQIFSQCWLKENLNVGTMIMGSEYMTDNDTIEKYCYYNQPDSCTKYGGLYQWDEIMQYNIRKGTQGICPLGWHIPTDDEWKILEGAADSYYGIGDSLWEIRLYRGYDVGLHLKSTSDWYSAENGSGKFGFNVLPSGYLHNSTFYGIRKNAALWSSETEDSYPLDRDFRWDLSKVARHRYSYDIGHSVRCIRDRAPTEDFIELSFTADNGSIHTPLDSIVLINISQECDTTLYYPDTIIQLIYPLTTTQKSYKSDNGFVFEPGDELKMCGYLDEIGSVVIDTPLVHKQYIFHFIYGLPCPGIPALLWHGQIYNTVLIGDQCWLKENMNWETGDSWCYNNDPVNCIKYGRLYTWETMMDGALSSNTVPSGVQGICPNGWHIPSDEEWKILEGTVDSQYGIGDPEWDSVGNRGYDAGYNLKSSSGWSSGGSGSNAYGFAGFPGGFRARFGGFSYLERNAYFWSSAEHSSGFAWRRTLYYNYDEVRRYETYEDYGFSVRCVKD